MNRARVLQYLRVPVLLGLVAAAAEPKQAMYRALMWPDLDEVHGVYGVWGPWFLLAATGVAFVAVALWGRATRHPPGLLAVEGIVAAAVGLVPPMAWVMWFGLGRFADILGGTTGNMFVNALAIAWLGIVLATALRQTRRSAAPAGTPPRSRPGLHPRLRPGPDRA